MSVAEPFLIQEYLVEGFDDFEVRDGIMSWVGYRIQHGERVAIVRLAMPVLRLAESVARRDEALANAVGAEETLLKVGKKGMS